MQKDQFENILTLTALVSQTQPRNQAVIIARNLAKIQRLAVSLHKRYKEIRTYESTGLKEHDKQTEKLEAKACELGRGIGIKIEHQRDPRGAPLMFKLNEREYWVF